jgi:alpha/beta superfamily hydrolase
MAMSREQHVFFGKDPILEGRYADARTAKGAVISHPHSLMGGDMDNMVVRTIAESLQFCNIATLRFNFRGVGQSEGRFDDGNGETEDVVAAVSFLAEKNISDIILAGYSFGAWVNSMALPKLNLRNSILVSPPLELFEFDFPTLRGKVGLIVSADGDQYCPVEKITKAAEYLCCPLTIIPDTDHFFFAKEKALAISISRYLNKLELA